jgi:hypothetical protein
VECEITEREFITQNLEGLMTQNPPRLFGTCDRIRASMKRAGICPAGLLKIIDGVRKRCFEDRQRVQDQYRVKEDLPPDWISQSERD